MKKTAFKVRKAILCGVIGKIKNISDSIGVRDGGGGRRGNAPPNSGILSIIIRAESRHNSGKTQYMVE